MELPVFMILIAISLRILGSHTSVCLGAQVVSQNFISWDDLSIDRYSSNSNFMNGNDNRKVILVSKDGTGDSTTVQGAVNMVPDGNKDRVKIIIFPGVYRERVTVPVTKPFISFIGNGTSDTVISWHLRASDVNSYGQQIGTFDSTSVAIEADYFCANGITFENSAPTAVPGGNGMQAVALRLSGDKSVLYRCKILGNQDTLFDHTGRHYFFQSFIEGSIDFIFGNAKSLYQECTIHANARNYGAIAASQRNSAWEDSGFSFNRCVVNGTGTVYLGRAWGRYARVVYSYCRLDSNIISEGWSDWGDSSRTKTVNFGEFNCNGEGANTTGRVPWARLLTYDEVKPYLDRGYIDGTQWLKL